MLLRAEKFLREFFKLKSYWMYLDRSSIAKIMRKKIPAREIVVLLYKKKKLWFLRHHLELSSKSGWDQHIWARKCGCAQPQAPSGLHVHQVLLCPSETGYGLPRSPTAKITSNHISQQQDLTKHQQPKSPITKITSHQDHEPPRSRSTEITKHQYPQQPNLQTPRPSRVPFDLTFSRAGVNCTVLDPSQ